VNTRALLLNLALENDFLVFLHMTFATLCPSENFNLNWHHSAIAYGLEEVRHQRITRLMVNVPPRSLKSITISVAWVAWMLGRDPALRFVCVSYSDELALKHSRDCRKIMTSPWYKRAFPGTVMVREAQGDFETTAGGGRFTTSVGGTLTGRGGDIIIVDDPNKPDDATSEAGRRRVHEWWSDTLVTRLNNKKTGAIIVVMQRVHEDDLAGRLLEAGDWPHLNLPAVAEIEEDFKLYDGSDYVRYPGQLLDPRREDEAVLARLQAEMGSAKFSAQYQQAPVPEGGGMIERKWLRRYSSTADRTAGRTVQSWDCATKDGVMNDYSVCVTAYVRKSEVYVLQVYRDRLKFPDLTRKVVELARAWGVKILLIEDAASGSQLIQQLQDQQPRGVPRPIACRPEKDKKTRMAGVSSRIERGELLLPENAPWLAQFERELLAFPNGRHDDQADALSQLLSWSGSHQLPRVTPFVGEKQSWFEVT
jgi:predicted phage terminase large subunit-like protein